MQWSPRGQAVIETVDEKEPCMGHPFLNIYPNHYHPMESCSHFCQHLGSRSPPLVTLQQWTILQRNLEGLINNRGTKELAIWLALDDKDTEGEWVDNYDHKEVNFSLPWVPDEPNGGMTENCAVLQLSIGMLYDYPCDPGWPSLCMCQTTPEPYVRRKTKVKKLQKRGKLKT